jgi:hypothetical protein
VPIRRYVQRGELAGHPRVQAGETAHVRAVVAGHQPPHRRVDPVQAVEPAQREARRTQRPLAQEGHHHGLTVGAGRAGRLGAHTHSHLGTRH